MKIDRNLCLERPRSSEIFLRFVIGIQARNYIKWGEKLLTVWCTKSQLDTRKRAEKQETKGENAGNEQNFEKTSIHTVAIV